MSYFFKHRLMKAWGKEIREAWDEADHPRGKTTEASNSGSFMPKGGAGEGKPALDEASHTYFQSLHDRGLIGPTVAGHLGLKAPAEPTENHKVWDRINETAGTATPEGDEAFKQHVANMKDLYHRGAAGEAGMDKLLQENYQQASTLYGPEYAKRVIDAAQRSASDEAKADPDVAFRARSLAYKAPDKIGLGAILRRSWGYDQTNIDYYEVVGMSPSGKTVTIREVGQIDRTKEKGGAPGPMAAYTRAVPGKYIGEPLTRRVTPSGRVNFNDYSSLSLWDGKDDYFSWDH